MAFVRWNQTTNIWEVAATPENPSTAWNHLPIGTPTLPGDTVNKAYVDGLIPAGGPFVPYVGANQNVNLGAYNLFAGRVVVGGGSDLGYPLSVHSPGQVGDLYIHAHSNIAHYYAQVAGAGNPSSHRFYVRNGTTTDELRFMIEPALHARVVGSFFADYDFYERGRSVPMGHWQAYTPAWKSYSSADGVIGNGTLLGRYSVVGRTVTFTIRLQIGTTTTFPASYWALTLPSPVPAVNIDITTSVFLFKAAGGYRGAVGVAGAYYFGINNSVGIISGADSNVPQSFVLQGFPWTWVTGDILFITGTYET